MTEVRDEFFELAPDPTSEDLDQVFRLCSNSRAWNGPMPLPFPISEIVAAARVLGVQSPARVREVVETVQVMDAQWRNSIRSRAESEGADADS
ncbi:hypothetical protein [Engelhardtia mirabilis]|uniref:Uncharacterized protein n=1 Tax=Engelhardtia mirabilis TaxID=2528011 RepID=A0A518BL81_9BACT|nr:hypothetical protein Pla133_28010 [Planctomycetes bacterium Pla133]QDV02039.1 hypothetical protein Pla86_28000 [Planctomycetes bacterium Pla86]